MGVKRRFEPQVFYADESQCTEWDAALLAEHPTLADEEGWRTTLGWYWRILDSARREVIDEGGPYASAAECRVDCGRALERLLTGVSPEEVADAVADALYDDDGSGGTGI